MTEEQSKIDKEALFRRADAAVALTSAGYPISPSTLATMASRGGGPVFRRFGPKVLYRWGDLIEWAELRSSPFDHSVSGCESARKSAA
jgi:hypothetical protein